ncbi:uncharacterized protein LOC133182033 [Saccostrea echinata]|uniref:uncharacterized protein LOC133182033 n=1 Tax=Saccostrea echinata TaxID=191078 RepID=UPI002A821C03|nr:uncharacterized protein LOC133182033 [Saccostrea echinata]
MLHTRTPLISFSLALCVYLTEACRCPTTLTFDGAICNADYAVIATVKEDPSIDYRYTLDVQKNYKTGDAPTEIYTRSPEECGVGLENGQTYILGGYTSDGVAQIGACDFREIYNGNPPPTPMCLGR